MIFVLTYELLCFLLYLLSTFQTFDRRYNLKVHSRRHTNEQPYPCKHPGCSVRFKWRSSQSHHMKTRHKGFTSHVQRNGAAPVLSGARHNYVARPVRFLNASSSNGSSAGDGLDRVMDNGNGALGNIGETVAFAEPMFNSSGKRPYPRNDVAQR